ncbi:MAG: ATP-binding protein [Candidatus Orphnella occulta]|nr:ATP-binding protein [Candidatus Orphnella occulta]
MNFLAFTGLINAATSLLLGVFVYLKNPKLNLSKAYLNLNLSIALYSVGYLFWQLSKDVSSQIFWFKFLVIGIILINPAFLHFSFSLSNKLDKKKRFLLTCYLINVVFIILNIFSLFYKGFEPKYGFGLWPVPSMVFNAYLVFWFFQVIYGFGYFLIGFNESVGLKREQIRYCIIAGSIGFIGGASNWPMWYNIKFPPFFNILIAVHISIVAYAIIRHKLMDIEVIIKKTLVFAGLLGFVFAVIAAVALLTQEITAKYISHSRYLSLAISAAIIVLLQQPVHNFLINITNKYLFQKSYDPKKVLKKFASEVLTILNLDKLAKVTVDTLAMHLCLTNCAILLLGRDELGFELYDSFGLQDKKLFFSVDSKLVSGFKDNNSPLLYESYDMAFQASEEIKIDMDRIQSRICMPLIIHDEIVGILSLGAKKSDQAYNDDDIDILTTLVKTLSIAISNARLFMEAAQYEKLATIGTIASAVNHEVCNPLNSVSILMQSYIISGKDRAHSDKQVKQEYDKAADIMQKTLDRIQKVIGITSKLSSFAKPSKIVSSKPIDVPQILEDALDVLKYKLQSNAIEIKKEIPSNLASVMADADQMQQILYNLIRNAAQSIKGEGAVTITARDNNERVQIEIADTGCGIPEEKLNKIFEPFFTTKVEGTGYGLSVVKELVLRNKGEIKVKSKAGQGSTFYLEFQKA